MGEELLNENVLVEDAPESVSLEELLGLTDVDLGESTTKSKVFQVSEKDPQALRSGKWYVLPWVHRYGSDHLSKNSGTAVSALP